MLLNLEGNQITPSVLGIGPDGNWLIGEKARAQYLLSPENTAIEVKRQMGSNEKIRLGKQSYTAASLSAKLLEYVKTYASEQLGEEVSRAVISVPAYFNDIQRQETVQAGTQAGFQVERILNEPTAAALSYGLDHMDEESHILVYDLGGGTFDVTLLEMFEGVLEVKASSGDNKLGGKDFDEKIIDWLADSFQNKHGIDLKKDIHALVRLKDEAENAKKKLSTEDICQILLPLITVKDEKPLSLEANLSVSEFNELCKDLLERTHAPIDTVLRDAGILPSEIDRIILVGGSTRMPMVANDLESYLGKKPEAALHPDFAVAEGAAIQAGIIEGTISPEDSLIMTDVNPFALGIRVMDEFTDEKMAVLIPRNVTIPTTRSEMFTTSWDFQTAAQIEIYQGESMRVGSNHFLGEFKITGIPPRPRHEESINVEFSYDLNGILSVKATLVSTGKDASIQINMMQDTAASEEKPLDIEQWKKSSLAKEYRAVIRRAEKVLKERKRKGNRDNAFSEELDETILEIEKNLYDLKHALLSEDQDSADLIEANLLELLDEVSE